MQESNRKSKILSSLKVEAKGFIEIVLYPDTFSDDMHIVSWGKYAIPDKMPKSTISKENDSFNIFQDHFYNKLQRSKM